MSAKSNDVFVVGRAGWFEVSAKSTADTPTNLDVRIETSAKSIDVTLAEDRDGRFAMSAKSTADTLTNLDVRIETSAKSIDASFAGDRAERFAMSTKSLDAPVGRLVAMSAKPIDATLAEDRDGRFEMSAKSNDAFVVGRAGRFEVSAKSTADMRTNLDARIETSAKSIDASFAGRAGWFEVSTKSLDAPVGRLVAMSAKSIDATLAEDRGGRFETSAKSNDAFVVGRAGWFEVSTKSLDAPVGRLVAMSAKSIDAPLVEDRDGRFEMSAKSNDAFVVGRAERFAMSAESTADTPTNLDVRIETSAKSIDANFAGDRAERSAMSAKSNDGMRTNLDARIETSAKSIDASFAGDRAERFAMSTKSLDAPVGQLVAMSAKPIGATLVEDRGRLEMSVKSNAFAEGRAGFAMSAKSTADMRTSLDARIETSASGVSRCAMSTRSIARRASAVLVAGAFAIAAPVAAQPAAPVLDVEIAALAPPDGNDARRAVVLGKRGEVFEPDGKGAWVRKQRFHTADTITAAGRAGAHVVAFGEGVIYKLAANGWSAMRLAQKGRAVMATGPRAIAGAVGRQVYSLDKTAGGEPVKLALAASNVLGIGAGRGGVVVKTDRGLFRVAGTKLTPIRNVPRDADRLVGDRWVIGARGVVELGPMKLVAWPNGFTILAAAPTADNGFVGVGRAGGVAELVAVAGTRFDRDPIDGAPPSKPVGVVVDGSSRAVVAFESGHVAIRERGAWTITTVREELPAAKPGAAPATSK